MSHVRDPRPRWRRIAASLLLVPAMLAGLALAVPGTAAAAPATFTNPINTTGPDPFMTYYQGYYYLMTTPWNGPLTMRKAPTIEALKAASPVPVFNGLPAGANRSVWAPEMHLLDGPNGKRWYIYYSAGDGSLQSQRVRVAESAGTDPMGPYTDKGNVFGSETWWGIDGSVVTIGGKLYFTWSGVETPLWRDGDPSIYIVAMSDPTRTTGPRTRISAPTLSWEVQGGPMNEGPVAIQRGGRTFMTYSASKCQGPDYKIGQLELTGSDPLAASSWTKKSTPIFERNDANSVFGPGHHGFFKSPDGTEDWIVYHANSAVTQGCGGSRTTRIQKITWNADGTPNLGVPVRTGTTLTPPSGEPEVPYYSITNVGSGKVVDVQQPNTGDRTPLGQYTDNKRPWQKWRFADAGGGWVRLESQNSAKCADVAGFSTAAGAAVNQFACHGRANQQWRVETSGDTFVLRNRHSNLCLSVVGGSTADGAKLDQQPCGTAPAGRWTRTRS